MEQWKIQAVIMDEYFHNKFLAEHLPGNAGWKPRNKRSVQSKLFHVACGTRSFQSDWGKFAFFSCGSWQMWDRFSVARARGDIEKLMRACHWWPATTWREPTASMHGSFCFKDNSMRWKTVKRMLLSISLTRGAMVYTSGSLTFVVATPLETFAGLATH